MENNKKDVAIIVKQVSNSNIESEENLVLGIDRQKWAPKVRMITTRESSLRNFVNFNYRIYRVILAAECKHFANFRRTNNRSEKPHELFLDNSEDETIKIFKYYCYSGNIVHAEQNSPKSLQVAADGSSNLLLEKCYEYASYEFSIYDAVDASTIVDIFNLRQRALELIRSQLRKVPATGVLGRDESRNLVAEKLVEWFYGKLHDEIGRLPKKIRLIQLDQLKMQV